MKKTLYVSDLDGTLLQPNATLSPFARNTLNELIEDGLLFSIATGRQLISVQEVLEGLNVKLPVIEKDGAFVSNLHTGEHYIRRDIEPDTAVDILNMVFEANLSPFLNTTDGHRDKLCYQPKMNEGSNFYLSHRTQLEDPRLVKADLNKIVASEHIVGFIIIGTEAELNQLFRQLMARYPNQISGYVQANHYMHPWHWMAIHHISSQKSYGIQAMQEMCGLTDVELVVFGDQNNDLPMIQSASRGIAMGNADPEVVEAADFSIGPNHQDSVVKFILDEWQRN